MVRRANSRVVSGDMRSVNGGSKNVIMEIVDDLMPLPDLEEVRGNFTLRLVASASESVAIENAQAQFPMCGPSRPSFMTGWLLPTTQKPSRILMAIKMYDFRK